MKKRYLYHVEGGIVDEYVVADNQSDALDIALDDPSLRAVIRERLNVKFLREVVVRC
jgi:hypothetical protein